MIPSTFTFLKALPLTNGKLDRNALPKPSDQRPELGQPYTAPHSDVEVTLARIWAEVLCIDRVGIHDNFFDLGGHSLGATRVVSQVLKEFQIELPLQSLFKSPTIADMAAALIDHQGKKLDEKELNRILTELELLSEDDAHRLLSDRSKTASTED
jgi:acyl carrier protein